MIAGGLQAGLGHSLDKFFADDPVPRRKTLAVSGLRGEVLSFQAVYRGAERAELAVEVNGALAGCVQARQIDFAHVEHPTYGVDPDELIGRAPGFYPDPLVSADEFPVWPRQTRGIWFTLSIPRNARAGSHRLTITLRRARVRVARLSVSVHVVPAVLPKQKLLMTHWFHNDCLLTHHNLEAWSREYWQVAERYLRNAAEHGINTILTPLFTPPLDTAVGGERPTVQLVDVTVTGRDAYRFDFRRLGRWIDLTRRCGMTHYELSHLATQWGAKAAPKIMGRVNGKTRRLFGWETPSTGRKYRTFLLQFLPSLSVYLKRKRVHGRSFLHVSDEPHLDHLDAYRAVREILREGAPDLPVLDALSNIEFYESGLVDRPAPSTDHAQPFLDRRVPHLWCYYCCGQRVDVANRFVDFPSARNRILGWQLYKFGFEGFLQWGYNFWYNRLSRRSIDPYTNTHGDKWLPPGDGCVVYPGDRRPVDSIRWEVFREGLQDMRVLRLLETLTGERATAEQKRLLALRAIKSMKTYPQSATWVLKQREAVNRAIGASC